MRFATEFPEQFATVVGRALGALNGIEDLEASSSEGGGSVDPDTALRLHEFYRRRIAPELESAATLASEANSAVRRSLDPNGRGAEAIELDGQSSETAGSEDPQAPDPPWAYQAWSSALEEQRGAAGRRRLFRRRNRRVAA